MLNLPVIEESVFLLIDMQERLVKAMSDIESCLNRQQMLLAGAGLLGWRVIVTEQYPRGLGPTVPAIAAALPAGTPVVAKTAFSCFGEPLFVDAVDFVSPRALIVAGIEAHVCVQQTVLDALNSGKVKAAGLDVWMSEKEPNWALAQHPAVSCTPHIGAGTKEAQKRIGAELVDIVEHFAF